MFSIFIRLQMISISMNKKNIQQPFVKKQIIYFDRSFNINDDPDLKLII